MDMFGKYSPTVSDVTDLDLIDPDNLYRSNDEVNHSDYLFEEFTSSDLGDRGDLFEYQIKVQNYQSGSLSARHHQPSVNKNFQQDFQSNIYHSQNIENSSYDDFRSLELPAQSNMQLRTTKYTTIGSYNNYEHFSTISDCSESCQSISSINVATHDHGQTFSNPRQPMNNFNRDDLVLPSERQCGQLLLPENADNQFGRQRRRDKLPNAQYNELTEDQKEERRKKFASKTSQRYADKKRERVRQLTLDNLMLPITIQENEEKIINMNKKEAILERAIERLRFE